MTGAEDQDLLEYDGTTGAVSAVYAYNLGGAIDDVLNRVAPSGARQTLLPDIQGSIIASLDSGGALTKVGYQAFGESTTATAAGAGPRYTGRRLDTETATAGGAQPSGLYYYRARTYSPTLGRFLQADPAGVTGGVNLYAYVNNDPLNLTDPTGLCAGNGCGNPTPGYGLINDPPIQPVYPLEYAIGAVTGGSALRTLGGAIIRQFLPDPTPASAPDFVVSPNGTAYPVPAGAQGPTPVINPAGNQTGVAFTGGSGGANGQVSSMRLMNPTPPRGNSPGYPNGYIVYQNNASPTPQLVDPITGQTTSRALGHFPVQ